MRHWKVLAKIRGVRPVKRDNGTNAHKDSNNTDTVRV